MQRDRRLVAVLLAALMVASVATLGGAAIGQSTMPADATNSAQTAQTNASNDTDGWPAPRADAGRTGATSDDGPLPYANTSWGVTSDDSSNTWLPVVAGDTVVRAYAGDDYPNGNVKAYDASIGEVRWEQTNVGEPTGPATIGDGRVFVSTISKLPSELPGTNRTGLYALNATTGEILWRVNDTRTAPVVAGDRVFTSHYPADPEWDTLSDYGNVSAHNATTGERIWTSNVQGEVVASADGRVFVTDEPSKTLTALDASDGSLLWRTAVGEDFYFEYIDGLGVTEYREGELAATDDAVYLTVGFIPRQIIRGTPTDIPDYENATAKVTAYAADDGAKLWEANITTESGIPPGSLSEPAVANGTVYVGGGGTHALDAETGAQQWTFSRAGGDPAVANGTVYVGTTYGRHGVGGTPHPGGMPHLAAFALDASDGTERWNLLTDVFIEALDPGPYGPTVADGRLYFMYQRGLMRYSETHIVTLESQDDQPPDFYQVGDEEPEPQHQPNAMIVASPPPEDGYYAPNTTVTLNASVSYDRDGEIVSYEWDLDGDGEFEATGKTIEVTTAAEACEVVTVTLRVTDDEGATDETTVTLQTEP